MNSKIYWVLLAGGALACAADDHCRYTATCPLDEEDAGVDSSNGNDDATDSSSPGDQDEEAEGSQGEGRDTAAGSGSDPEDLSSGLGLPVLETATDEMIAASRDAAETDSAAGGEQTNADAGVRFVPDNQQVESEPSGSVVELDVTDAGAKSESVGDVDAAAAPDTAPPPPVESEPEPEPEPEPRSEEGRCANNGQCEDGVCRVGQCQPLGLFGEACDVADGAADCSGNLVCAGGTCRKPAGQVCSGEDECASELCECADNGCSFNRCAELACGTCTFVNATGDACTGAMSGVSDLSCNGAFLCQAGECVEPCNNNDDCTDPETCREGICQPLGQFGEACDYEDGIEEQNDDGEVIKEADPDCGGEEGLACDDSAQLCKRSWSDCVHDDECVSTQACGFDQRCRLKNGAFCLPVTPELCATGYCGFRFPIPLAQGIEQGSCAVPRELGESCDDVELDCVDGECSGGVCVSEND